MVLKPTQIVINVHILQRVIQKYVMDTKMLTYVQSSGNNWATSWWYGLKFDNPNVVCRVGPNIGLGVATQYIGPISIKYPIPNIGTQYQKYRYPIFPKQSLWVPRFQPSNELMILLLCDNFDSSYFVVILVSTSKKYNFCEQKKINKNLFFEF